MAPETLTVSELFTRLTSVVVEAYPSPVWVRGEISGFKRTSRGAGFFRLADPDADHVSLDVAGRGMIMADIDRVLSDAGLGGLRDGVGVRIRGTVSVDERRSGIRFSLLEVDPEFTAGRLALDRDAVLKSMTADGSLAANGQLPLPLVPLRVGLVTSRGSAAHGDFTDQLRRSRYRFSIKTVHTPVQGDGAPDQIALALGRLQTENLDMVALVRGGGSKLDLSAFDSETVARAVAAMPVPVVTGLGHEMDRTVADEAAAVNTKTPSAAGEWLVVQVRSFANRLDTARHTIRSEALGALGRHHQLLRHAASDVASGVTTLHRQRDRLDHLAVDIASATRDLLEREQANLTALEQWFSAVDVEPTLKRGFAIVTREDSSAIVRSANQVDHGDLLLIRLPDGTVRVRVESE